MRLEERVLPTPERLAKGGLRIHTDDTGGYISCTAEPDTVLAVLIDRGTIEPVFQDYADELHEWRRSFLAPVRYHPPRMGRDAVPGTLIAASRYLWLQKRLARKTLTLALDASTPGWVPDLVHPTATYRLAFERLAEAIREGHQAVTEELVRQNLAAIYAKK